MSKADCATASRPIKRLPGQPEYFTPYSKCPCPWCRAAQRELTKRKRTRARQGKKQRLFNVQVGA
jgi:hypothetical protein